MANDKQIDYAALIRAARTEVPQPPDWLAVGKQIYSGEHGIGEVMALLGKRLIVRFLEDVNPVQFSDWVSEVESNSLLPSRGAIASASPSSAAPESTALVSQEQIQAIPHLNYRAIAQELAPTLVALDVTEGTPGDLYPLPKDLPPSLHKALNKSGIANLYSHQLEALNSLRAGMDLCLVTPTASGKTLCYNLPILESCLQNPRTTALYIFPLKALATDQMQKLRLLVEAIPDCPLKIGLMTGDTPKEERMRLFVPNPPNILAVSPDLLHYHLYNLRREDAQPWRQFLQQLHWVVCDEAHNYIASFGAHFTNLMRRLRLGCDRVGGNSDKIQFICSSATIGNPIEMALRFSGRTEQEQRLHAIEHSGARSAGRTLLCLTPSSAANPDACKIIISWLQHDLSGIVFYNSRAAVKNLLGSIQRETQRQGLSYLATKVAVFYSSLTSVRRREIVGQLQSGRLKVILSTSALEAGIDLPELDCCLLRGFPGSLMSFWQRVGRAGRSRHGLVIFLPVAQNPLDAYYGSYPEQLLSGEVESAAFNPDYPTILSQHLECGCVESGIPIGEVERRFGASAGALSGELLQQERLYLGSDRLLRGRGYPHREINLRSSNMASISLIDTSSGEAMEKMSLLLAHREVFPGAIYTRQDEMGELVAYRSESLDLERGEAVLAFMGKDTDKFTEAESQLNIKLLSKLAEPTIIPTAISDARLRLTLAWGEITTLVTGYRLLTRKYGMACTTARCQGYRQPFEGKTCPFCKRSLHPSEITTLTQSVAFEQPYKTQYQAPCVKVEINPPLLSALQAQVGKIKAGMEAKYGDDIPDCLNQLRICAADFVGLHSMEHQIVKAVPLVVLSSSLDVDTVVDKSADKTVGYFFDTSSGGNGAAEAIFHQLPKFAAKAQALAHSCDCEFGCPRCLTQHGCPQQNWGLHKDAGLFLLDAISRET